MPPLSEHDERPTVVVAGASGFIGRALGARLADQARLIGLSRSPRPSHDGDPYEWRRCDLFSRLDAERALADADYAVYLVHSMTPSAALTQADFRDLDLICADNFARAAEDAGCPQIVYLGGIIPEERPLSEHLASRLEVEETLAAYAPGLTSLRASLVVGPGGSSTEILIRLVRRLPVMLCPSWTGNAAQPIALDDVVELLAFAIGREELYDQHFDVGGPDVLSYRQMMERTAAILGARRSFLPVPLLTPRLSTMWVSTVTGYPRELVKPLVGSLRHPTATRERRLQEMAELEGTPFDDALQEAIATEKPRPRLPAPKQSSPGEGENFEATKPKAKPWPRGGRDRQALIAEARHGVDKPRDPKRTVRSVQRLEVPGDHDAQWIAEEYARWLPRFMNPIIKVRVDEDRTARFYLRPLPWPLLELDYAHEVSRSDRHLYWITGGILAADSELGRLEFREVLHGEYALAAIHEFIPRLPWYLYVWTQARVHLWVMRGYQRHLSRLSRQRERDASAPRALTGGE